MANMPPMKIMVMYLFKLFVNGYLKQINEKANIWKKSRIKKDIIRLLV